CYFTRHFTGLPNHRKNETTPSTGIMAKSFERSLFLPHPCGHCSLLQTNFLGNDTNMVDNCLIIALYCNQQRYCVELSTKRLCHERCIHSNEKRCFRDICICFLTR